ncbi:MAG: LysR family transcriptional regulator, partial [Deltaproteobacteria bacterium]|nr:LysR family transcriptional regulator [Deltaproteobacteria bacterium]
MSVVRQGTVHGAAREIGLSQTGVTQRIRALERSLGATLFTRSRKGMRLTTEGEGLYRHCQRVRDMEGEVLSLMQAGSDQAAVRLHITGPSSMMRARIIPSATRILESFPGVVFTFDLDDDESGLVHLKSGRSQLAVLPAHEVVDEIDSKLLRPARYILVGPPAWKGRAVREVVRSERIIDFNEKDDATLMYLRRHRLHTPSHRQRHFASNTDALAMMVSSGLGYSVLSKDFAAPFLEQRQMVEL